MAIDLLVLAGFLVLGIELQRRRADADRIRERIWNVNYVVLIPIAAAYAFLTIHIDRTLVAVVACGVAGWWLTVLAAGGWSRLVAPTREARGALWLVGAFPNTGFVGFPLAYLAFGADGLRLAVVYDQVSLVVPMIVVATVIARRHARADVVADAADRSALREALTSPPLITVVAMLALRATLVPDPIELDLLGRAIALVIGPVGFLLLGLSIPLGGFTHRAGEVLATLGAVAVRVAVAPLLVLGVAWVVRVEVPHVLLLCAALPTAFMTIVISRLHDLEVEIVRLGLVISTTLVVAATIVLVAVGLVPGA
jgi:predicted permease